MPFSCLSGTILSPNEAQSDAFPMETLTDESRGQVRREITSNTCQIRLTDLVPNVLKKQIRGTYVCARLSSPFFSATVRARFSASRDFYSCHSSAAHEYRVSDETGLGSLACEPGERDPQEATLVNARLSGNDKYRRS